MFPILMFVLTRNKWMYCEEKSHDLVQRRLINQDGAIETVPFHCGLWVTINNRDLIWVNGT